MSQLDLIGEAIARFRLRHNGKAWLGLCPFHQDRHPSFAVYPDGGYRCFGCGAHGSVASLLGQPAPRSLPPALRKRGNDTKLLSLPDPRPWAAHPKALAYFTTRGLIEETVRRFSLGWVTNPIWKYRFWRYSIPCWRLSDGKLMGIKLRHIEPKPPEDTAKYIFWPGSTAWLFNEAALDADEIVVCEGEIDCITLAQVGIAAVCSTAGVRHFSDTWLPRLIGKRVVLWFDNDKPGREGALRLAQRLEGVATEVKIVWDFGAKDVNDVLR